jgi:hypothetical protein
MNARLHIDFRAAEDCGHLSRGGATDGKIHGELCEPRRAGHRHDFADALTLRLHAFVKGTADERGERGFDLLFALAEGMARGQRRRLSAAPEPG